MRTQDEAGADPAEPTTALPVQRPADTDPQAATEVLNARARSGKGVDNARQRRGGGLSAQDLLRREGRF